jgi:ABC-type dipeptide/oligopeptide/nickel transport system permease component
MIPTLLGVSVLVFFLLAISGDPTRGLLPADAPREQVAKLRAELHLDDPIYVRYFHWLKRAVQGDLGKSYTGSNMPVAPELMRRLPATLELGVVTMFFATLLSVFIAVMSVRKPGGAFDQSARTVIFVFLAMPGFWLGIELIILFSRRLGWFPPAGRGDGTLFENPAGHLAHLALPAITLGVGTAASLCRVLRASLLEILYSDFIRTAKAKGLSSNTVLIRHALRNALIPFVTLSGLTIAGLLEGSIIIESVFAWPGIGQWMVDAIKGRDTPVVMAGVLLTAVIYSAVNLVVDILYTVIDPRVRLDGGSAR